MILSLILKIIFLIKVYNISINIMRQEYKTHWHVLNNPIK